MKFTIIILTIGIPGSGKSRWVAKYLKDHPLAQVVSTDALRKEITGVEECIDPSQNTMIHEEARKRVKEILDNTSDKGVNVREIIVDSTNCTVDEWLAYKKLGSSVIRAVVFDRTPAQAMENQTHRKRYVPLPILEQKWNDLQRDKKYLSYIFNMIDYIPYEI